MKYCVVFANKPYYNNVTDNYFVIDDSNDAYEAFAKWEIPKDFKKKWLLIGVIPLKHIREYMAENDGIPRVIRPQCELDDEEKKLLGI